MKTILCIPDGQNAPDRPIKHWAWVSTFIADQEPDIIVQMGDWDDCDHLSRWDEGTRRSWGREHAKSIEHSKKAQELLLKAWWDNSPQPELHALGGNHDGTEIDRGTRMYRTVQQYPQFADSLECPMKLWSEAGWKVHPYKKIVKIEGIAFSHLFNVTSTGKKERSDGSGARGPIAQISAAGCSAVAGHTQGFQYGERTFAADPGRVHQGLMAGSCYLHNEGYLGNQGGNNHFRGIVLLHVYKRGSFDIEQWSLERLRKVYG